MKNETLEQKLERQSEQLKEGEIILRKMRSLSKEIQQYLDRGSDALRAKSGRFPGRVKGFNLGRQIVAMGHHPTTKSRAYREGWRGRRRTYRCRICGNKFQVDRLESLPVKCRICPRCRELITKGVLM